MTFHAAETNKYTYIIHIYKRSTTYYQLWTHTVCIEVVEQIQKYYLIEWSERLRRKENVQEKKIQFNHHYYFKFPGVWVSFLVRHRNGSNFGNHYFIVCTLRRSVLLSLAPLPFLSFPFRPVSFSHSYQFPLDDMYVCSVSICINTRKHVNTHRKRIVYNASPVCASHFQFSRTVVFHGGVSIIKCSYLNIYLFALGK